MGCGGSKEKLEGVDKPLEHWMERINMVDVDDKFRPLEASIKEMEEIRETIVDKRDEMYETSGACAYKNPNVYKAGTSVLWKLSTDNSGEIARAGIDTMSDPPYIVISGNNSVEGNKAANIFINYCAGIKNMPSQLSNIFDKLKELADKALANQESTLQKIKSKLSNNPMQM